MDRVVISLAALNILQCSTRLQIIFASLDFFATGLSGKIKRIRVAKHNYIGQDFLAGFNDYFISICLN